MKIFPVFFKSCQKSRGKSHHRKVDKDMEFKPGEPILVLFLLLMLYAYVL